MQRKTIAHRLEDVATARFDRCAQQVVVAAQRLWHNRALLFPMLRAALNVGKEQRNGTAGKGSPQRHGPDFQRKKRLRLVGQLSSTEQRRQGSQCLGSGTRASARMRERPSCGCGDAPSLIASARARFPAALRRDYCPPRLRGCEVRYAAKGAQRGAASQARGHFQRFLRRPIFGPRRAIGCELFDVGVAQLLAQRCHELVVAPLLGGFALHSERRVLRVYVAEQLRSAACVAAEPGEQHKMLQRSGDDLLVSHLPRHAQPLARRVAGCGEVAKREVICGDVNVAYGNARGVLSAQVDFERFARGLQRLRKLARRANIAAIPHDGRLHVETGCHVEHVSTRAGCRQRLFDRGLCLIAARL